VTDAATAGDALAQSILVDVGGGSGWPPQASSTCSTHRSSSSAGARAVRPRRGSCPRPSAALAERILGGGQVRPVPPFELTDLGDDAGMVGAALLAVDRAAERAEESSP
jgi:glucokinase